MSLLRNLVLVQRYYRGRGIVPAWKSPAEGEVMGLNLDAWWDEPEYKPCNSFHLRGRFILRKLYELDHVKLDDVMTDLYRDDVPDPQDIGTFEWQTILVYMRASEEEIKDVQRRMGRVWR